MLLQCCPQGTFRPQSFTFDWSSRGGREPPAADLIGSENIYSGTLEGGAATDLNLLMLTVSAWSCFGMKIDRPETW